MERGGDTEEDARFNREIKSASYLKNRGVRVKLFNPPFTVKLIE